MKKKPLISIVMNCHNGAEFLKESLISIVNQEFKNWELIFWDNQSTDNSPKIFLSFNDSRFKYFRSKKFTNLYTARNLAIRKTKGKIITFLDVDDLWLPQKLKQQVNFFKRNNFAEIVYSNYYVKKKIFGFKIKKLKFKEKLPNGNITNELLKDYKIGWLTVAIKKSIIKDNKKFFDEKVNMIADFDLMIRLSLKKKIFCIQKPLAIYRHHPLQLTRKKFLNQASHFLKWSKSSHLKQILKNKSHQKNLNLKIEFFEELILLKRGNYSILRVWDKMLKGKIKLSMKLIAFIVFPNFFKKYIMSI